MNSLLQDLRYGFRMLLKNPGSAWWQSSRSPSASARTQRSSCVVNAVLLRPLTYKDPDRLVSLAGKVPERGAGEPHRQTSLIGKNRALCSKT